MEGIIFDITRGSFVDGYGIRTTIFLKGCPLRCLWCCNPESQNPAPQLKVVAEDCNSCGACERLCDAITSVSPLNVEFSKCTLCGKCFDVCPTPTLSVWGSPWTIDKAFCELMKDKPYYDRSGGGVTIGGGEATLQGEFTYALMKRLQEAGVHVAIDTCGYTTSETGVRILEEADLLLFDLKGIDPEKHKAYTGVNNQRIIDNLRHRGELGKDVIIRLPLIPGYTDDDETLQKEAELIQEVGCVHRVDLLPFHDFGKIKYAQTGKEYKLPELKRQSKERLQEIAEIIKRSGVPTQVGG